jgi:8-amino-7-oxononanoate synthase
MSQSFRRHIAAQIAKLRSKKRLRTYDKRSSPQGAQIILSGKQYVNFSSNDYLGLSNDPLVLNRVRHELSNFGFGTGSAPLLSGFSNLHQELITSLCEFTGTEDGLLFSSGYLANVGVLQALVSRKDVVFHDRLNHASLIDGVITSKAKHIRYPHLTTPNVRAFGEDGARKKFLVTESVFSMDGDRALIGDLASYCQENDLVLYVDDAHGFGVTNGGLGAAAEIPMQGSGPEIFLMITFGKALGSMGAAILGNTSSIGYLRHCCRTSVYDTALATPAVAAALEALHIIRSKPAVLHDLRRNIETFKKASAERGLLLSGDSTPIQPILINDPDGALLLEQGLRDRGFYVPSIRPPTVPSGSERLRVTITAKHSESQIQSLVGTIAELLDEISFSRSP